jgi:DNA polymerase
VSDARELLRKYLKQREELGEGPVFTMQREPQLRDGGVSERQETTEAVAATTPTRSGGDAAESPPRGIVVQPPSTDLFTDDIGERWKSLEAIAGAVEQCRKCRLCEARAHPVPGEGSETARLVVVGEGPGAREDETGRPFVGRAGELLTDILRAIELERDSVFICNIVKCRPPSNRTPHQDEIDACVPYLYRQLEIVRPRVILAMGSTAVSTLLDRKQSLGSFRGTVHSFRGIQLIATYHPAALLRNPNWKRPTWDDVRIARQLLDE